MLDAPAVADAARAEPAAARAAWCWRSTPPRWQQEGAARRLAELQMTGYRVLLDGALPQADGAAAGRCAPSRATARDDAAAPAGRCRLCSARTWRTASTRRLRCAPARTRASPGSAATTRCEPHQRTKATTAAPRAPPADLLALLARDADSRELEAQLKQDPALSFHLLKLVNSAAFSRGTPITSFGQAISRLGRRQLQRWLQLLLYARHAAGRPAQPAAAAGGAARGALLEALCKRDGGDRDEQDLAFMAGVFSLLDRLFRHADGRDRRAT